MCEKFQEFCVWATCKILKRMGRERNCLLLYIDIYLLVVALKQYSLFMSQELVGILVIEFYLTIEAHPITPFSCTYPIWGYFIES